MLTQQQKNIKKMIKELKLKYDDLKNGTIYIEKNKKIKDIQDVLFYLLKYGIIETGRYTKVRDYILVYNEGIGCISYNNQTGRTKIEMYKQNKN